MRPSRRAKDSAKAPSPAWEHKRVNSFAGMAEMSLNRHVSEGWEIVTINENDETDGVVMYFRRPKR